MRNDVIKISASILAADFARLGEQVVEAERAGDGHFVPNITFGLPILQSLRRVTRLPMDVHLMISNADPFLQAFVEAGASSLLVHWEGSNNLHRTVQCIRELGRRPGVVINPATPATVLEEILPDVDLVLVMAVDPGFGHQRLLPSTLAKITRLAQMIEQINHDCELAVDGGIDKTTAPLAIAAGADVLVAGSAIFATSQTVGVAIETLRAASRSSRGA